MNTILFDLDGTLLPIILRRTNEEIISAYSGYYKDFLRYCNNLSKIK